MRCAYLVLLTALSSFAQSVELLWPRGAPGAAGQEDRDKPTLTVRLAPGEKANGTAVIVFPGGGYTHLAFDHEGMQVAAWLNARGISAFNLKYRHAPAYKHPRPFEDAQRAIRTVRSRAAEWKVDPRRIGVWGFSAGGHLASTVGTRFDEGSPASADAVERASSRPDFLVLAYPVISLSTKYTHQGSRKSLLGDPADPALAEEMSTDKRVTERTPPTFLFHTGDDPGVPVENSVLFYLALRKAKVPAEMHVYQKGRHGVGLAKDDPVLATWTERLADWLKLQGFLP